MLDQGQQRHHEDDAERHESRAAPLLKQRMKTKHIEQEAKSGIELEDRISGLNLYQQQGMREPAGHAE